MIHNSRGFIFLMTLCMLLVMSVLVLTCMQHVLLYYQAINKVEKHHREFYALENIATQLAQRDLSSSPCIEHSDEPNKIVTRLATKAQCSITYNSIQYHYLIEDLGVFPCLIIEAASPYSSYHRRISVLAVNQEHNRAVVQIRFIHPVARVACSTKAQAIKPGVSSWRYLSEAKIAALLESVS